jgi:hypothetical protein
MDSQDPTASVSGRDPPQVPNQSQDAVPQPVVPHAGTSGPVTAIVDPSTAALLPEPENQFIPQIQDGTFASVEHTDNGARAIPIGIVPTQASLPQHFTSNTLQATNNQTMSAGMCRCNNYTVYRL